MKIGDRVSIKQKVFVAHDPNPFKEQIVRATVIEVNHPFRFAVKYDEPQDGYEYRVFPFDAIPEIVQTW